MGKIFKRVILASLGLLFIIANFTIVARAQDGLILGQKHAYSVLFRGNGEAIVRAKLVLSNSTDDPLKKFSFEMPEISPYEEVFYQMELPLKCVRWEQPVETNLISYSRLNKVCVEYADSDYSQDYYYRYFYDDDSVDNRVKYHKIKYKKSGNKYTLDLPLEIKPYASTAIIASYATKDYAKENTGLYKINFKTLKVSERIREANVAVDIDSDLFVKERKAKIDYNEESISNGALSVKSADQSSFSNPIMDREVNSIGEYGYLNKTAKNLAPGESFIVRGEYATSWLRLYLRPILITIFIIIAIIVGLYFLVKFLLKRHAKKQKQAEIVNQQSDHQLEASQQTVNQGQSNLLKPDKFLSLANILTGLLSAVLVVVTTILMVFLFRVADSLDYSFSAFAMMASVVLVILSYILVVFGPAIFIATKRGWKSFLAVLVFELIWILLLFVIFFLGVFLFKIASGSSPFYRSQKIIY